MDTQGLMDQGLRHAVAKRGADGVSFARDLLQMTHVIGVDKTGCAFCLRDKLGFKRTWVIYGVDYRKDLIQFSGKSGLIENVAAGISALCFR